MGVMDPNEKKSSIEEMSENKRYCTDCKTTRTPLWRGGPAGPKSLCNACGIRYRKKRRALMGLEKKTEKKRSHNTTATTHNTSTTTDTAPTHIRKENVNDNGFSQLLKVRLMGFGNGFLSRRSSSSSSSSSSSPPPPVVVKKQRCQRRRKLKEEEQAAFSLMALSCGSVFA